MAITPQQRIQIKRRNSVPASAEGWAYLLDGELGYIKDENGLYIGLGGGNSAVKVNVNSWDELKDKPSNIISQIYLNSADPTKIVYKKVGSNTEHALGNFAPLTNGLIDLKYLPQGALERLVVVANATERLKLTTANVQLGDTVKETNTGLMYVVVDESKLNSEDGYRVYVAGRAAAVDWTGVENKVNATASSAGLMSAVDKKKLDNTNVAYGTCSTAASTAQKNIVITSQGNWSLQIGSIIVVKFTHTNTAQKPVFKVGNAAAKSVWYNTALISTSNLSYAGYKDRPSMYMYDGTQFVWLGWTVDSNSDTKVTQSAAITTAGEYPVLLGYSTATTSVTNTVNKAAAFTYNPNTKILTANTFKGALTGNADTATKLKTARTIAISGGATGTATSFDGSGNITIPVTALDPTKLSSAVAINKGGTGATTAAQALINLGLTATAAELNYVDGVSSNIQTQLNGKAPSTHTHEYLPLTGGDLSGQLNISANTFGVLTINRTTASKIPGIGFKHQGTLTGYLGMNTSGEFVRYDAEGTNGKKMLDANNYKDYCTPANIGAAATSHGTHVSFTTTKPVVAGTAAVGTATTVSRSDHVHPAQTTVSGNAGSATKLATARTLTIGATGKSFNGSANVSWTLDEIGAAAASHKHAAGDITSGTLAIARGGTGATTAEAARTALGAAPSSHTHNYLPLAGGTLTGTLTVPGIIAATPGSGDIGQSGKPFLNMCSRNFILYDQNNIQIAQMYTNVAAGTTTSVGTSYLVLGNNKKSNVAGNAKGYLGLYSNNNKFVQLTAADGMTSNKTITLPDVGGTVALAEKTLPLTGGTLTGALTISDGGINVIGGATIAGTITTKNQVVLLYNGLGRIYTAASQVQLEARKENANTNRMVFQVCQGDDVSTYARLLKYTTNPSTASDKYQIYGSHNITKGTSPLTAGTSELTTNFIYLQYE